MSTEFSCSTCHRHADCVEDSYCHCKPVYVGNGKQCCAEGCLLELVIVNYCIIKRSSLSRFIMKTDMGGQVTLAGATAYFRCDRSCDVPFFKVTWYKNGALVSSSQKGYGLEGNGKILYFENLTITDMGEYSCEVDIGGTSFRRYGSLDVIDVRKTNLASSTSCCKSYSSTHLYFISPTCCVHPF